tara:strand:+ start:10602 stop:10940 length:339 start_codon:yes stop_codon:yes gene_type:complete
MEHSNVIDARSGFAGRRREGLKSEDRKEQGRVILLRTVIDEVSETEHEADPASYAKLVELTNVLYERGDVDASLYLQTYGWNILVNSPEEAERMLSDIVEYLNVHKNLYPSA